MQKCLLPQLGRNIHVYVDDIMVKTKQHLTLLDDLKETFANLREYKFLSRLGERALPLYQLMKKTAPFEWNDQADEAFWDLKRMLSTAPVLAAPAEKEPLLLYIATTSRSVSTVMVVERPEKDKVQAVQRPFQEHVVTVVSTVPLGEIIGCRDASSRIAKWALELAGHTILYEPRTMIKSQALADFLIDWTETQYLPPPPDSTHWRMHFDGSKCSGEWDTHDSNMASYRFLVQKLSGFFAGCEFLHVRRAENEAADTLAKTASSQQSIPSGVSLEHLHKPFVKPSPDSESIHVPADPATPQPGPGTAPANPAAPQPGPRTAPADPATPQPGPRTAPADPTTPQPRPGAAEPGSGVAALEPAVMAIFAVVTAPSWALPISEFLENGVLPMDEIEARKRSHQPASALRTIPIAWPFAARGLDMVGPFKTARGGMTHLLVAVDKFTKWIEARPIKNIAVRYGMPNNIIMDNGTNFAKGALAQYCSISGIRLDLASVTHPQSNGQLSSPWEGPFIVSKALCDRNAYYLIDARKTNKRKRDTAGEETTRPWNAELLRLIYS
ncbi:uncharacterized protein [Aegilops tauschii subsp. strangulata]|uniref:uncharacterized protein n=1 Tax=Aegilops tauschii subsp. strangulata TaxID=200361 RepID=UPI003CC88ED8